MTESDLKEWIVWLAAHPSGPVDLDALKREIDATFTWMIKVSVPPADDQ